VRTGSCTTAGALLFVFLIILSYVTALVYLTFRGKGIAIRAREAAGAPRRRDDEYIREAAGCSPAQEIAGAKTLIDAGTITPQEFDSLKAKALHQT
jgi:hypothetical protein